MPKAIRGGVKIACLDFSLQKIKMKLGVQILVSDPDKLEEIRARESDMAKERIDKILAAGATVILTTGGIDEMTSKYLSIKGVMGVRRVLKTDLKRIAKASGATLLMNLASDTGEEAFEPSFLGEAEEVVVERISDDEVILIRGFNKTKAAVGTIVGSTGCSIILRGPNEYYLDEMERSVHDALCSLKRVLESKQLVPGGGAVEVALSIYLESFATSISSREQLAIAEFAKSLLVIPRTLAVNAAKAADATDLVAKLRSYHNSSQTKAEHAPLKFVGLDLTGGDGNDSGVRDNVAAGVLEPAISKIKSLKFATEAAITILRIDDLIKLQPLKDDRRGGCGDEME